jgi:hypothetical protein
MGWLGDTFLGARPDLRYTGPQGDVMNMANDIYGFRNPLERGDLKKYRQYEKGDARAARFLTPLLTMADSSKADAMARYRQASAPGFNQGGAGYNAAVEADLGRNYDRDKSIAAGGAYAARGEQLHDRVTDNWEAEWRKRLGAAGLYGSMANNPHDGNRQGGLLNAALEKLMEGGISAIPF